MPQFAGDEKRARHDPVQCRALVAPWRPAALIPRG
jgi:hypothetical protein